MKRYLVFACDSYYPSGGWGDFIAAFDDLEEARTCAAEAEKSRDWVEVIDLEIMESI